MIDRVRPFCSLAVPLSGTPELSTPSNKSKIPMWQALYKQLEAERPDTRLGSGWISGVAALLMAGAGLMCVAILRFPELLSTPEIRAAVDVGLFRLLVLGLLISAFTLACISLILRQNRILGIAAVTLCFIAVAAGGSNAQRLADSGGLNVGLDWFMLNLLMTGIIFIPLERLFRRVDQSVFRFQWREDLFYFLISSLLVQTLAYMSLAPAMAILKLTQLESVQHAIASQPLLLQFLEIMLLTDFVQYWVHRAFHTIPWLWRFHAVHHSAQRMDWLAGSRMHLFEIILLRGVTVIPMYVLGYSETAIYAYLILVYLYATYIHANLRFDVEWVKPLLVTPRFHHWHHGTEAEAVDVNFAIHFPWLDKLFGSYYMPKDGRWPAGYGVAGNPVPNGFLRQFAYPFRRP